MKVRLGEFQGLTFGITLHPYYPSDVFLEGATTCMASLTREHAGPRAVLNALIQLSTSYAVQFRHTVQELELSQQQLIDYQTRFEQKFEHDEYCAELTKLRDQLRLSLSGYTAEPDQPPQPPLHEIASAIKRLKDTQGSDDNQKHETDKPVLIAEEPIVSRLRRKMDVRPETAEAASHSGTDSRTIL